jgi:hypothetical protein
MKEIKLKSTSLCSAASVDLILRETKTTRLVFRPLLIENVHDREAAVKGTFIFQRKGYSGDWEDHKELILSQLRADEWIKLELKSAEILKLYRHLDSLYALYEQEGIPYGESHFIRADMGLSALLSASEPELKRLLSQESDNAIQLLSRFLNWLSEVSSPEEVIDNLERLDIKGLRELNSIIGLTTLKSSLEIWERNKDNSDEEFWQSTLEEYSFVLSQVFSYPLVIVKGKAYVGGKSFGNVGGNLVDFLARNDISKNAVLIEIKTPQTPLLGSKYRSNIYNVATELSGAIVQVSNYKDSLLKDFYSLGSLGDYKIESFEPACVVLAGNYELELVDEKMKRSFELFRSHLRGVELITYDELFGKVRFLINLLEGIPINQDLYDKNKDTIPF